MAPESNPDEFILMNLWKKLDIYLLKVSNAIGSNISTEIIRTIKLIYLFKV